MSAIPAGLSEVHAFVAAHGGMLLAAVTALLSAGWVAVRLQRCPVHRQRLGEFTVGCTVLWLALACVPMPRLMTAPEAAPPREAPPPEPIRPLRLPATMPADGVYVASYEGADAAELGTMLATLTPKQRAVARPVLAAAAGAPPPRPTVRSALALAYLAGVVACTGWLVLGHLLLWRMLRAARSAPAWLTDLLDALHADEPGVGRPRLFVSGRCDRPFSCGVLRPTVVLPAACVRPEAASQLRHVLLHELAHVRRRDAAGNGLFNLAMPLLYFHPLYWMVRADVHLARELVADDWAAGRTGRASYVADLVALAGARAPVGRVPVGRRWAAVGLFLFGTGSPTNFYRRMHMLMHRRDTESLATRCSAAWRLAAGGCCGLALAAAVAVAGVRSARAQDRPRPAADADAEALKGALDEAQALEQARDELNKAADDAKRVAEVHRLRAVEVKAAAATKLDALKQQLQANPERTATDDEKAALLDMDFAARHEELRQRESEIAAMQEKLKAADLDLAKRQQSLAEQQRRQQLEGESLRAKMLDNRLREGTGGKKGPTDEEVVRLLKEHPQQTDPKSAKPFDKGRKVSGAKDAPGKGVPAKDADPFAELSGKTTDTWPGARRADDPGATALAGMKLDAGAIDLVGLATSYADAVGDVRMAEARVAIARESDQAGAARLEEAGLAKARHKARLLRSIAEVALKGAAERYERTRQLYDEKVISQAEMSEVESRLHILKLILDTGDAPAGSSLQRR